AVFVALDIVGAGIDRGFEHLLFVAGGGRIFDQAHPVEAMADAAAGAEVAAIFGEDGADVGGGAVAVVAERFDDDRNAAGTKTLVADLFIILGVAGRRLVDRLL